MTWKRFLHCWSFFRGIHRSQLDSHQKVPVIRHVGVVFDFSRTNFSTNCWYSRVLLCLFCFGWIMNPCRFMWLSFLFFFTINSLDLGHLQDRGYTSLSTTTTNTTKFKPYWGMIHRMYCVNEYGYNMYASQSSWSTVVYRYINVSSVTIGDQYLLNPGKHVPCISVSSWTT